MLRDWRLDPTFFRHCDARAWLVCRAEGNYLSYLDLFLGSGPVDFGGFAPSFTAVRNLSRLLLSRDTGHPVNLVGPPGKQPDTPCTCR